MNYEITIVMGLERNKHGDKVSTKDSLHAVEVLTEGITDICQGATINYGVGTYTHKNGLLATEKNIQVITLANSGQHVEAIRKLIKQVKHLTAQESILLVIKKAQAEFI